MKKNLLFIFLFVLSFVACKDDDEPEMKEFPVISFDVSSARYKVKEGNDLVIAPTYEYVNATSSYAWKLDKKIVGRSQSYTFNESKIGTYFLKLQVMNDYGTAEEELKVTVLSLNAPMVSLYIPDGGFQLVQGESKTFTPVVENKGNTTYEWTVNGTVVSQELEYTYSESKIGSYTLCFKAKNEDGEDYVEIPVKICSPSEMPFQWNFPRTEYNLSVGRRVKIKAYNIENDFDGIYTWSLNGTVVAEGKDSEYIFEGTSEGTNTLILKMVNNYTSKSQNFTINVCPPEGTYRRVPNTLSQALVNKVFEYMPAPGHQVNGYSFGAYFPPATTMEIACDSVLEKWKRQWNISLGACGGYVVAGFDHSVENSGGYDLLIKGNPYGYQSEPGIVWVSQDENGDGLPNDTWYELQGSEYFSDNMIFEYAITYYKPTKKQAAIKWTDNLGKSGIVPHMTYWNPQDSYYQPWVPGDSHTFYCTRLVDHSSYDEGSGMSNMPAYPWGYADNEGSDYFGGYGHFKISNAMTFDHKPANLKYIDFVKIQTAPVGYTQNLGDISTEVHYVSDLHLEKDIE